MMMLSIFRTLLIGFSRQQQKYNLTKVISDNFRTDIVRRPFEEAGIPLEVIKNPTAIHGLLAPRIDTMFAKTNCFRG